MALDARHRSSIYQKIVPILGDDDANALMSEFPASEADGLVTKQFLRAEFAELRGDIHTEIGGLRTQMKAETDGLRSEMHTGFAELRSEMHTGFGELRSEMHTGFGEVRDEMRRSDGGLRLEIEKVHTTIERKINRQNYALAGVVIATVGALKLLG